MVRWGLLLAATVAACTVAELTPEAQAAQCVAAFQDYDRAVRGLTPSILRTNSSSAFRQRNTQFEESRLRQFGCLTTPNNTDLADSATLPAFGDLTPGAATRRAYVHVAIASGDTQAGQIAAYFRDLGYQTRTQGAPALGRRVYLGPLTSEGAQAGALQTARAAGFPAAYLSRDIPVQRSRP